MLEGTIGLKLVDSFLLEQMPLIVKSPKIQYIFGLLAKIFTEKIFCRKDSFVRKNFPGLYILLHQPQMINIDKHFR